ncbi:hypothetical protein [Helicobacter trogontum]|uniref:hypothetical protein n=1 Tax=Helicobacter trogontum TaxID=50960 RepID=UPI000CF07498|nr:hypothetical protein [Helicobacter trogontum]
MKKVFYGFLILMGLGIFYYTPLSFYFQPSYWKFKKMCKMQYDFIFKGVGDAETINKYRDENGFIDGVWYTGIYVPKGYIEDLYWEEQWINCNSFYNKWDKDWYDRVQKGEIYGK